MISSELIIALLLYVGAISTLLGFIGVIFSEIDEQSPLRMLIWTFFIIPIVVFIFEICNRRRNRAILRKLDALDSKV